MSDRCDNERCVERDGEDVAPCDDEAVRSLTTVIELTSSKSVRAPDGEFENSWLSRLTFDGQYPPCRCRPQTCRFLLDSLRICVVLELLRNGATLPPSTGSAHRSTGTAIASTPR